MIKNTQTIRREIADELFEYVWPFCEIGAERVKSFSWFKGSYFPHEIRIILC